MTAKKRRKLDIGTNALQQEVNDESQNEKEDYQEHEEEMKGNHQDNS